MSMQAKTKLKDHIFIYPPENLSVSNLSEGHLLLSHLLPLYTVYNRTIILAECTIDKQ